MFGPASSVRGNSNRRRFQAVGVAGRKRPPAPLRPGALLPPLALLLLLVPMLAVAQLGGCAPPRAADEQSTSLLRGDRQRSRALRASEERPRPFDRDHGPFSSDRLALEPHIARQRAAHHEEHERSVLVMESFSHPACSGLPPRARRTCPLLAVRWTARREVGRGMTLVTRDPELSAAALRRQVLCHVAFGQVHGAEGCPLHASRVRATTAQRGDAVILTLVSDDPAAVQQLRRQLRQLVP